MLDTLISLLQSGEEIYEQNFSSLHLPKFTGKLLASHATLERIDFNESTFPLDCSDVTFRNCNFSFSKLRDSSLSRVRFDNCNFTGSDFIDSYLRSQIKSE